jgi:hypothetical protein
LHCRKKRKNWFTGFYTLLNSSFRKSWGLRNEVPQLKRTVYTVHIIHSLNSTEMVDDKEGDEEIKGSKEMRKGREMEMGREMERAERGQAEQ